MVTIKGSWLCAFILASCAGNPGKTTAVIGDTGKVIQCVIDHAAEPPESIALDCAGVTLVDVIAILSVKRRIELRANTDVLAKKIQDSGAE